jgi:hypothetical protein
MSLAADEQCVRGCVHGQQFTGNLVNEVNQTRKLTGLAPMQIVEVSTCGPQAAYEGNDLAGYDSGHLNASREQEDITVRSIHSTENTY